MPRSRVVPLWRKSSPATMTVAAIVVAAVAAVAIAAVVVFVIGIGIHYGAREERMKQKKSATGGTINSYAKHVCADTHTQTSVHARLDGTHLRAHLPSGSEYSATERRQQPTIYPRADINTCDISLGREFNWKSSSIGFRDTGGSSRMK